MQSKNVKKVRKILVEVIELIDEMNNYEELIRKTSCYENFKSGKHRAAVKRRSLDLSRALADMRNR